MFKVKRKGPWRELRALLKNYDKRWRYVERIVAQDVAEAFLANLKENAPEGEEYKPYIDSLEAVELTSTGGKIVFGVICNRQKVKVGELQQSENARKTVVYIHPVATGQTAASVEALASINPWPVDLIPHGLNEAEVTLVHQTVTEGEYAYAKTRALNFVGKNRAVFKRHGLDWGNVNVQGTKAEELSSLPDWLALAIRSEFGINAPSSPHWRPSIKWIQSRVREIAARDGRVRKALFDNLFREHLKAKTSSLPTMKAKDFVKEAGVFEKTVAGA